MTQMACFIVHRLIVCTVNDFMWKTQVYVNQRLFNKAHVCMTTEVVIYITYKASLLLLRWSESQCNIEIDIQIN